MKVTAAALPLIGHVVTAYGSPYGELIVAFADAVSPNGEEGSDEDEKGDGVDDEGNETEAEGTAAALTDGATESPKRQTAEDSLNASVDIVREALVGSATVVVPVRDGDALTSADNYKVLIGCDRPCHAYVAQLDATGRLDPILPSPLVDVTNPLPAGRVSAVPGGSEWLYLDENLGVEQIYVIVSETPRPDIERVFERVARANAGLVQLEKISLASADRMPLTRGLAGVRPGEAVAVEKSDGENARYVATLLEAADDEIVLTRWFNHLPADR